jgi:hypothetical protein
VDNNYPVSAGRSLDWIQNIHLQANHIQQRNSGRSCFGISSGAGFFVTRLDIPGESFKLKNQYHNVVLKGRNHHHLMWLLPGPLNKTPALEDVEPDVTKDAKMVPSFRITFREVLEAALVVGIVLWAILAYLFTVALL